MKRVLQASATLTAGIFLLAAGGRRPVHFDLLQTSVARVRPSRPPGYAQAAPAFPPEATRGPDVAVWGESPSLRHVSQERVPAFRRLRAKTGMGPGPGIWFARRRFFAGVGRERRRPGKVGGVEIRILPAASEPSPVLHPRLPLQQPEQLFLLPASRSDLRPSKAPNGCGVPASSPAPLHPPQRRQPDSHLQLTL